MQESGFVSLSNVHSVRRTENGFEAGLAHEKLRVDVIKADLIRLKISRGGVFDESPSFALAIDPISESVKAGFDRAFELDFDDSHLKLNTIALELSLNLADFNFKLTRMDGSVVAESIGGYQILNNDWRIARKANALDPIYGLGEKTGKQNRRGRDFHLWNTDVLNPNAAGEFAKAHADTHPRADSTSTEFDPYYVSIPFFYHQDAATSYASGSFIDNGFRAYYDFRDENQINIEFNGGQYTEYLFAGPSIGAILRDYTWLTGRTQLPPIWALGYHQCRWNNYSQQDVLDLAARHRDLEIPLDTLWLDIDYMDGYRVFTWNTEQFPNVPSMLEQLRKQGIRVITIIDPGVKFDPGYEVFDSGLEREVFCLTEGGDIYIGQVWPGNTAFPDFVNPDAREWWGDLNAQHVASGLAGIWNDMNEPATGGISPTPMRFGKGKFSHERYHNSYALLMAMGTEQGLRTAMPDLRTFILSRAGSAGIQRYAANWLGDNMSRWDHLWLQIPMATGLSLSGQSFVGADIGGFAENSNAELFARWIQAGALTPFARNHNSANQVDQYAFAFGEEVLEIARKAVQLRYRLMPYLYQAFVDASETGAPIQRPLIFDYQNDVEVRDLDDQYLLGGQLLVAPVLEAGAESRAVYLPKGGWYCWYKNSLVVSDGARIKANAPLERIPMFVKAGSVIPMWPAGVQSTADYYPETLELRVYAPIDDGVWESRLQEDDGLTFGALAGDALRTTFTLTKTGSTLTLSGTTKGNGYAAHKRQRLVIKLIDQRGAAEDIVLANSGEDFKVVLA
ncbi:MAG: hypothetical protein RJA35_201 [Actinomycetota bacterium]